MYFFDLIFICDNMYNFLDVETADQIFSENVWCPDDNIVNVLDRKRHQNSLLQALERVLAPLIVADHIVIP